MEDAVEQSENSHDILENLKAQEKKSKAEHLAPWQFKPGQSGNPKGRHPGKSLKEWAKEYLSKMTDEERLDYFKGLNKTDIWKMAEGNPHSTEEAKVEVTLPTPLLHALHNNDSNQEDSKPPEEN